MNLTLPAARAARAVRRSSHLVVEVSGLSKRFPVRRPFGHVVRHPFVQERVAVLRDVSLEIGEGEFFGLLGPNGAGKTTLFKTLATLVLPDGGAARVDGFDVVRQPDAVRRVLTPVISDERSLYWRLSACENLRLYAALQGLRSRQRESRVSELLALVGLADAGPRMVGQFSSGMKQRLLIARALLSRPKVLLLDEPTRSLDPISARGFREFLKRDVAERQGCTVLLATHSAEEALDLCDRLAVLHKGRILAIGAASDLAREFGDERYRIGVALEDRDRLLAHLQGRNLRPISVTTEVEGWSDVEVALGSGGEAASSLLASLALAGLDIAWFERVRMSLADLLDRIVTERDGEGAGGP